MHTPFSVGQFYAAFSEYNAGVWPMQLVLFAAALLMVALAMDSPRSSRIVVAALAALWGWMAIAYHVVIFTKLTAVAYVYAAAFLIEAAVLAWHGLHTRRLHFALPREPVATVVGTLLIAYALIGYPAISYALGQQYPAVPTFGLPCPTVIFTFGLLAWCVRPVPWSVLVIPAAWALLGTSAALNFGLWEDLGLLPSGIIALAVILWPLKRRTLGSSKTERPLELGF